MVVGWGSQPRVNGLILGDNLTVVQRWIPIETISRQRSSQSATVGRVGLPFYTSLYTQEASTYTTKIGTSL